ncbi:hypothetical protein BH10PSE7_BH10PSE7_37410 [soil metagenome]
MIRHLIIAGGIIAALAACAEQSRVSVTKKTKATVDTRSRSEPIFYNGKHYLLTFDYNEGAKVFDMRVSGTSAAMTSKQEKDAVAIATSSLGYFSCPDGQRGRLQGSPRFGSGTWAMQARCA